MSRNGTSAEQRGFTIRAPGRGGNSVASCGLCDITGVVRGVVRTLWHLVDSVILRGLLEG